ncbi:MAG: methylated-DNA--[protein]-cysteine S-methyltransferase [Promethearchaeota archaeon]
MEYRSYTTFSSPFDTFTIVWKGSGSEQLIERIFLSDPDQKSEIKAFNSFNQIKLESAASITLLGEKIQYFLKGENIEFDLDILDFTRCLEIQKKVLLADFNIPRGFISTYKRIANYIGITNGARVIGNALARNPFPIVIPCHRAIKTNGDLGGYQGGIKMKRKLLEMEGIEISERGKVISSKIYY